MKHILAIGDIHMGSLSAIVPEQPVVRNWITNEEHDWKPLKEQEKLRDAWFELLDRCGKVDMCIANGDICDGTQKKSEGLHQWTTDKRCQANNAAQLLSDVRTNKFRISQGSKYHVCENMSADEYVSDLLGDRAVFQPAFLQHFKKESARLHVMHKIGTTRSTWQYLTTPLARDLVLLKLNESAKKYGPVNLAIRSHAHIYVAVSFSSTGGVVTPCWQLPTPFMVSAGLITPPEIGAVEIFIEDDGEIRWKPHIWRIKTPLREYRD